MSKQSCDPIPIYLEFGSQLVQVPKAGGGMKLQSKIKFSSNKASKSLFQFFITKNQRDKSVVFTLSREVKDMFMYLDKVVLFCIVSLLTACTTPSNWTEFHGNSQNYGSQLINSSPALTNDPFFGNQNRYHITSASPVIGKDPEGNEVIYVGGGDGTLAAINHGETFLYKLMLQIK
ncbi:MAG: hypothetical protein V3V00_06715 [Saprospiraceae bacterium]